jgi:toxin ParE1/3/4
MSRYVINSLASRDINEISDYFAEVSIVAGERFFQALNRKFKQLVDFPNSGKPYADIHPVVRGLSVDGYIIFYRILDDGIEILRVVNGRRDFTAIFQDWN